MEKWVPAPDILPRENLTGGSTGADPNGGFAQPGNHWGMFCRLPGPAPLSPKVFQYSPCSPKVIFKSPQKYFLCLPKSFFSNLIFIAPN